MEHHSSIELGLVMMSELFVRGHMSWVVSFAAAILLAIFFAVLGFLVLCAGFGRRYSSLSACFIAGLTVILLATLFSSVIGWTVIDIAVTGILCVLLSRLCSLVLLKSASSDSGRPEDDSQGIALHSISPVVVVGLLINFAFLLVVFVRSGLTPGYLVQQYDNPFHFSVVKHILETGNASPIGAGSVMGDETAIYPDIWHAVTALLVSVSGADIQTCGWVVISSFIAIVAPIGFYELYRKISSHPSRTGELLALVLPVVLPRSVFCFAFWGSLYSNILGFCVIPAAMVLLVGAVDRFMDRDRADLGFVGAIAAFAVVGFCHPNSVFTLGVFLLPYIVYRLDTRLKKIAAVVVAVLIWIACFHLSFFARTVNCLDRVGDGVAVGTSLLSRFGISYEAFTSHEFVLLGCTVIALALVVGLSCLCARFVQGGWYFFGIGFTAVQVCLSFVADTRLSQFLTGFWYRDNVRILVSCIYMGSVFVPILFDGFMTVFNAHSRDRVYRLGSMVAAVFALLVAFFGYKFYTPCARPGGGSINNPGLAQLGDDERRFFSDVKDVVGNSVVLNSANDASVWCYSLFDINTLVKGRAANQISSMTKDECRSIVGAAGYDGDSLAATRTKAAFKQLHVKYVLQRDGQENVTMSFNDLSQIQYQSAGPLSVVTDDSKGYTPVLKGCGYTLYRVDSL